MSTQYLQVVPNPYQTLDADGNPTAVYPCHRKHAPGEYVGAKLTINVLEPAETVQVKRKDRRGQVSTQTLQSKAERSKGRFEFATEPVQVPSRGEVGAYYRAGVTSGVLIPADAATARACGVTFEPVKTVLAREQDEAAKSYRREFGTLPSWAATINNTASAPQ
jgi:hypothetical protein